MSKLARTIPVVAVVAALMAAPSGAGAATQVGETFTPVSGAGTGNPCFAGNTFIQSTSPNGQYAVPLAGVITSWSFAANSSPPSLKFKVGRSAGGDNFSIVGESAVKTPAPNQLNTYLESIAVQPGDLLGLYTATNGDCVRFQPGYNYHFRMGDQLPGPPAPFAPNPGTETQFDISALVEPDCDKDGLGDETQDTNLSTCPAGTTPTGPITGPGGAPVTCRGVNATIVGTNGSDVRVASPGRDVIAVLGGNDTVSGLGGGDVVCGGAGKDTLKGGKGKDSLLGQKGKDALKGGPGRDLCKGGKGTDTASKCEVERSI